MHLRLGELREEEGRQHQAEGAATLTFMSCPPWLHH